MTVMSRGIDFLEKLQELLFMLLIYIELCLLLSEFLWHSV